MFIIKGDEEYLLERINELEAYIEGLVEQKEILEEKKKHYRKHFDETGSKNYLKEMDYMDFKLEETMKDYERYHWLLHEFKVSYIKQYRENN